MGPESKSRDGPGGGAYRAPTAEMACNKAGAGNPGCEGGKLSRVRNVGRCRRCGASACDAKKVRALLHRSACCSGEKKTVMTRLTNDLARMVLAAPRANYVAPPQMARAQRSARREHMSWGPKGGCYLGEHSR
jgi:hypothetical protein